MYTTQENKSKPPWEFPVGLVVRTALSLPRAWVQSLAGEVGKLRSHKMLALPPKIPHIIKFALNIFFLRLFSP